MDTPNLSPLWQAKRTAEKRRDAILSACQKCGGKGWIFKGHGDDEQCDCIFVETPTKTDLLPCPFCGGEVIRDCVDDPFHRPISCGECGIAFPISDEAWNSRPIEAALTARAVEAERARDELGAELKTAALIIRNQSTCASLRGAVDSEKRLARFADEIAARVATLPGDGEGN